MYVEFNVVMKYKKYMNQLEAEHFIQFNGDTAK